MFSYHDIMIYYLKNRYLKNEKNIKNRVNYPEDNGLPDQDSQHF